METELFGPVVTIYVYEDAKWSETLKLVDETSEYALTGAVFSQCRYAVEEATVALQNAAGNFYINDKPTGAVVGMQPFGRRKEVLELTIKQVLHKTYCVGLLLEQLKKHS